MDLSAPKGVRVNDGISKTCSLHKGALMTKMDIKSTFRVPVYPDDHSYVACGMTTINFSGPFSPRSAPKIFDAVVAVGSH